MALRNMERGEAAVVPNNDTASRRAAESLIECREEAAKKLGGVISLKDSVGYWQEQAVCATTDPEIFFPEKGGSTREAKKVCMRCPVRQECLEYALNNDERFGVWGGLSERERRKLKGKVERSTPERKQTPRRKVA